MTLPLHAPPYPAAEALLAAGLAKLHPAFDPYSTPGGRELEQAQAKARAQKLKVRRTGTGSTLPLLLLAAGLRSTNRQADLPPCLSPALLPPRGRQVWEKDEPEAAPEPEEEGAAGATNGSAGARETMEVVVSDVTDANGLHVQVGVGDAGCAWRGECRGGWRMPAIGSRQAGVASFL